MHGPPDEESLSNNSLGISIDDHSYPYHQRGESWRGGSHDNVFMGNTICNSSGRGIDIHSASAGTVIYHNNFINNTQQARADAGEWTRGEIGVSWDDGHISGGNYWDDYAGQDGDADGRGDTPYIIDGSSQDRHPLMKPWTAVPEPALLSILGLLLPSAQIYQSAPLNLSSQSRQVLVLSNARTRRRGPPHNLVQHNNVQPDLTVPVGVGVGLWEKLYWTSEQCLVKWFYGSTGIARSPQGP